MSSVFVPVGPFAPISGQPSGVTFTRDLQYRHSMPEGDLYVTVPGNLESAEIDDIEQLFGLIIRVLRRVAVEKSQLEQADKQSEAKT